jgi:DNA-binding IclR family transcriptional regulator
MNGTDAYRLEALLELAAEYPASLTVAEVARRRQIPATFLARLLGDLAREDLVATTRGPRGGVRLAVSPDALALTRLLRPDPPPEAGGPAVRWLAQRLAKAQEHALAPVRLAALLEVERERSEASDFAI